MKKYNLFYLSGLLFFLAAALNLFTGEDHSTAVVWLCLAPAFCVWGIRSRKNKAWMQPRRGKICRGCNSLGGSFVFQTEQRNFDKEEVCVCQRNQSAPLPRPALT